MVIKSIRPILLHQASSVEVKANSEREYDAKLHNAIDKTVHSSLCGSVRPPFARPPGFANISQYFIDKTTDKNWFVYPWNSFHLWLSTYWGSSGDWEYRQRDRYLSVHARLLEDEEKIEEKA